ncbi:MAG: hypothetical protein EOO56_21535 [Hymenobacter sp.]|nr:MAG: hypothetical protein EOO56_21535 [Hymenobacter sp.]
MTTIYKSFNLGTSLITNPWPDSMFGSYPDLRLLDETDQLLLGHREEDVMLISKRTGAQLLEDSFYGNPEAGLISPANDWAVIIGEHVTIWHRGHGTTIIAAEELRWGHALRMAGPTHVEILTDPWGAQAAIWLLSPLTCSFIKLRDFPDYREQEYTDQVIW